MATTPTKKPARAKAHRSGKVSETAKATNDKPIPMPRVTDRYPAIYNVPEPSDDERELDAIDCGWSRAALAFRTGVRIGHKGEMRVFPLEDLHAELEARKERYYKGSPMELLHAIQQCAEENMPLPWWLAYEFQRTFSEFLATGRSLDKAFAAKNLPTTDTGSSKVRRDWQIGLRLCHAVWSVASRHTSLDGALKDVLANGEYGYEITKARELVTMVDENQHELTAGKHETLSQFFRKARKQG